MAVSSAILLAVLVLAPHTLAKGQQAKVHCEASTMTVEVPLGKNERAYLDQLKGYGVCAPSIEDGSAVFRLDLEDVHKCGVTRLLHQPTGKRVFYHKVVVERSDGREVHSVRCSLEPVEAHSLHRRDLELPVGFQEPENLTITKILMNRAPEPQLGVAVSQDGKEVSGEISVRPGTPLAMRVFLDEGSAPVYGLMVSHLQVSDTATQQETIVFNGCSVDPYLFDNFVTNDGDSLEARFRAFKFPDTTYVQFRGTVTICLDKCPGAQCSNGVVGYGRRRRRAIRGSGGEFEISLTTFIKVEDDNNEADDISRAIRNLKVANQQLEDLPKVDSEEVRAATVQEKPQNLNPSVSENLQAGAFRTEATTLIVAMAVSLFFIFNRRH